MDELQIFGASGAVGTFLLSRLRAERHAAIACSHQSPLAADRRDDPIRWRHVDLWRDGGGSAATAIVSAGPLDAFASWLARVDTPALRRVVALGSMSIDAKRDSTDAAERAVVARLVSAEQMLRATCSARGIDWTILRPTLIWGAARDRSLTPLYRFGRRYGFVPVPMTPGGLRQPVHAADVADACLLALQSAESIGAVIPIAGGEQVSIAEMWIRVASQARARSLRLPIRLMLVAGALAGSRGVALRAALQRWRADQIAETRTAARLLPGWHARPFVPVAGDFIE